MRRKMKKILVSLVLLVSLGGLQAVPFVIGGPDGSLAPVTPYWTDGSLAAYRGALENATNFGAGGVVSREIQTSTLTQINATTLAGVDAFIAPAWHDSAPATAVNAVKDFFLAGGHLILMNDRNDFDPVGDAIEIPTLVQTSATTSTGNAPLFDGPFGAFGAINHAGLRGNLDPAVVSNTGGTAVGFGQFGGITAAVWDAGVFAPGAGSLVIITDVDMVRTTGSFSPLNNNGRFGLNIAAFVVNSDNVVPEPGTCLLLFLGLGIFLRSNISKK